MEPFGGQPATEKTDVWVFCGTSAPGLRQRWTAEFRIPFRSLRFKESAHVWGINFRRMVRWNNEISFLTAVPPSLGGRRGLTRVSSVGTLHRDRLHLPHRLRASRRRRGAGEPDAVSVLVRFSRAAAWASSGPGGVRAPADEARTTPTARMPGSTSSPPVVGRPTPPP
jgi:hypothetical protein